MDSNQKTQEYWQSWRTYATQAAMAYGVDSGLPAYGPEADDPKYLPYYKKLAEILDSISSGFPDPTKFEGELAGIPEGADLQYLKTYYLPQHVTIAVHVPATSFASTEEIAQHAGVDEADALTALLEMAERACIFHKKMDGKDYFRHMGPFPGQVAMSAGRLTNEFWRSIEPYMAGYMRPVMYDQAQPAWRWIPLTSEEVAENKILPYDNAEKLLLEAEKVAVTSCICRAPNPNPCSHCEPPYEVCLQLNDFADFYVNDLKISRYIDKDEVKRIIQYNKDHHLAMTVSGSQSAEIICSCCPDCCGPFAYYKRYGMGGPNAWKVTNYYLDRDETKCTNCGECAKWCFSQEGLVMKDGKVEYHADRCVCCGVCVRSCPNNALILRIKNPEDIFELPKTTFDLYEAQGLEPYGRSADHLPRASRQK